MTSDRLHLPDAPTDLAARLAAGEAVAWSEPVSMTTYEPAAPDPYPMFLDRRVYQGSSGRVYPIPFTDRIAGEGAPRTWQAIHLENRWLRLMVLPELGGRIHVGFDKTAGYDFFYRNNVIKPALVGLAGPWISGGVEFNWPQHHRPATFLPVQTAIEEHPDGAVTVWCSDHDPFTRMKGTHGIRLHPDRAVVELAVRLHNRTSETQTFLWWANVAARVHDDYQSFFPTDVRYVADHARRAITAFPRADRPYYGVDYPARGDGRDRLDLYRNITVPTSYMVTDTRDDFFGGYDHRAGAGFVHVADRRIAPGKKQWTWGNAPFGHAWDRHLTDEDGPYVELMAGVYTDNQPDFSWLEPGETKSFTQTWYPIHGIGPAHQANDEAAVRLDAEPGRIAVGVCVSRPRKGAVVAVTLDDETLWTTTADLEPGVPLQASFDAACEPTEVELTVTHEGARLISWRPRPDHDAPEPRPATAPLPPESVESVDELYYTGVHLAQYRHPSRSPIPYWTEGLRRDPGDVRCSLALADDAYRRAEYAAAERHARRALERLTARNLNPRDGEASYVLGLILRRTGREEAAVDAFAKAAWDVRWLAPASLEIARIDARAGRLAQALDRAETALRLAPDDTRAHAVRTVALRGLGRTGDAAGFLAARLADDPLDQVAQALDGRTLACDARTFIDVALELAEAGASDTALALLAEAETREPTPAGEVRPIAGYHRARLLDLLGRADEAEHARKAARGAPAEHCFPSGLDDHDALRAALDADPGDARAAALLGMLLFDRGRTEEALECWELAIDAGLADPVLHRNAALATYAVYGDDDRIPQYFERAIALRPDARLVYELDQFLARRGVSAQDRLARLDPAIVLERDDATVVYCELLTEAGRHDEARSIMEHRAFAPWEGGEGRTLAAWEGLMLASSRAAEADGDLTAALDYVDRAIDPPPDLGETRIETAHPVRLLTRRADLLDRRGDHTEAETLRAAIPEEEPAEDDDRKVDYFATSLPDMLLFPPR
ncbi:DUF5107 domain-containing protein [Glycomyces harbinensis]|uniref:Tetratricopeptide repeat-containing protein n=1 Tax=Glycomyces harbinensis TaxID=58114 RepID=A0A1G6XCV7_9ACTN|nr:DUF5107 domain-containing protein [Glycomyces harbinensis]SDD75197.1 Tetratricopeptide repeat-containing protein [Glycomyces harbinensis]